MIKPIFISTDSEAIIAEIVADYEAESGRTLQPGQAEMLLINKFAYREKLLREQIQAAGLQMLIAFSVAPALDYLVELLGVYRLGATSSSCTIQFTLSVGHGGVVIPANTRVATSDGQVFFSIQENVTVPANQNTIEVSAFCSNTGTIGNDYAIGTVNNILDPWPYLVEATNITITTGGGDQESDDALRERAKLAPAAFSVAGPTDAYIFWAKTAHPDIIDVQVISPTPGLVNVYPLLSDGIETQQTILTLVANVLNDEKVRPLTDTVGVISPTVTNYNIVIEVQTYEGVSPTEAVNEITAALTGYSEERARKLGRDIKTDQLIALSVYDINKIFDVTVVEPAADITIPQTAVLICGTITVNVTGTNPG